MRSPARSNFVARLQDGRVFGSGAVIAPDGASIARDVSVDFGKPFSEHWLLGYDGFREPTRLEGISAVVATALGHGYCHWLLEELPRLISLCGEACDNLICDAAAGFAQDGLALAKIAARIVTPRRYDHFVADVLVVPSLVTQPGYPDRPLVDMLRELVRALPRSEGNPKAEKIYVSREKARRRRVTNEGELRIALEARGFRSVVLEDLSWAEQITVFQHAKIIVAPHGAGLANLAFCAPGARVVEFFNRAFVDGYFWRLAAVQQLDYQPIVPDGDTAIGQELKANRLDLEADVAQIIAALR